MGKARVLVFNEQGRVVSEWRDPTGDPEVDDFNAPIPADLGPIALVWGDLVDAINAAREVDDL